MSCCLEMSLLISGTNFFSALVVPLRRLGHIYLYTMKHLALQFVLNTGEIRKTHELDFNAYFAVLHFDTEELKKSYETWDDECESRVFPVELATALFYRLIVYYGPLMLTS